MASKRTKKKTTAKKRKKRTPKKNQLFQLLKIPLGLAILIALISVAMFLTHHLLLRKQTLTPLGSHIENNQNHLPNFQFEIYPENDPLPLKKSPVGTSIRDKTPRIAIIIDDIGYDRGIVKKFLSLRQPLTLSMLPQSPFKKSIARAAHEANIEIILHQPMEPFEFPRINPGPGTLLTGMSPDELVNLLTENLDEMPFVSGINNHMGSKMTASASHMRQIFSVLKQRNLFFVDSRTTEKTICRSSASLLQVPFGERDIFIDHFQDDDFIQKQFFELVRIAESHGQAIGIAHPYNRTYRVLRDIMPELLEKVRFVPVSEVVELSG